MQRSIAAACAALGLSASSAFGYSATANVTFSFGGNSNSASNTFTAWSPTADLNWRSGGSNQLSVAPANSTYFTTLGGYNSLSYYNPDFVASTAVCAPGAGVVPPVGTNPGDAYNAVVTARKYGCRWNSATGYGGSALAFSGSPVTDPGPVGQAGGALTVTDTTLTGTLTIVSTTDEPTGGTSSSVGNGASGYNYRSQDGSAFGNVWYGVSAAATLQVNLTGSFTASSWQINGGGVKFTDAGFLCQQGGTSTPATILCAPSTVAGGYQSNGAHLSWGWDVDGAATGTNAITPIEVRNAAGDTVLATLSGVLASLTIDGNGNITTIQGEFRRGVGSAGGGCSNHIRYYDYVPQVVGISCGTLTAGKLTVAGQVLVPLPAAAWLGASALALLGTLRRRRA